LHGCLRGAFSPRGSCLEGISRLGLRRSTSQGDRLSGATWTLSLVGEPASGSGRALIGLAATPNARPGRVGRPCSVRFSCDNTPRLPRSCGTVRHRGRSYRDSTQLTAAMTGRTVEVMGSADAESRNPFEASSQS